MIQVKSWVNVQSEIKDLQNLQRRIFTHRGGVTYEYDSLSLVFEQKPIHYSPSMRSKRNW